MALMRAIFRIVSCTMLTVEIWLSNRANAVVEAMLELGWLA